MRMHVEFVVTAGQIYYPTVKDRKEENGNERNINIPKAPDERLVNEKNLLPPCRITLKF